MDTKSKIKEYVRKWESKGYPNGIPDEAPFFLEKRGIVPSYRMICIALMRNSNNLESLGIPRRKSRIYHEIKREEIYNRNITGKQFRLEI
jgi:predicted phosphoadenosine phosphosulfate sulfurtransferase